MMLGGASGEDSGGGAVDQIAQRFGIEPAQAQQAIESLLPSVTQGLHRQAAAENPINGGLDQFLGDSNIEDGNGILGQIFGSKDVSRAVAAQAAGNTGLDPALLKAILPIVASLAMGALSRNQAQAGGGLTGILGSFLDRNKDGSSLDDILGMAGKMFGQR